MGIRVTHYSDILCIWAYVSQVRIDQLRADFGEQVAVDQRLLAVFGNVGELIEKRWRGKGGVAAYNRHVLDVASQFDHVSVNEKVFIEHTPTSSLPAHLYSLAVKLAEQEEQVEVGSFHDFCWHLREAFFIDLVDISDSNQLKLLLEKSNLPVEIVTANITGGGAYALLSQDLMDARDQLVRASPTLIFNEDRQRLTGNVGYRIIEANIRELLNKPMDQQSWC
jgi:predicted DsbA family dithiol-disulfide isomerase